MKKTVIWLVTRMNKQIIKYLNSVKGIACVFVFFHHFYYGFCENIQFSGDVWSLTKILHTIFYIFLNGAFAVSAFSFIAGYFSTTSVKSIKDIIYISIKRYIRLALPLFAICTLIWAMDKTISFDSSREAAERLKNAWLYNCAVGGVSFIKVLKHSFFYILLKGDFSFSSPLWMLRPMFFGQILFAVFCYIDSKNHKVIISAFAIIIVIASAIWSYPCLAAFCGGLYKKYGDKISLSDKLKKYAWTAMPLVLILGSALGFCPNMNIYFTETKVMETNNLISMVLGIIFMLSLEQTPYIQKKLESPFFLHLGDISLSVYLVHMPIITTLSCTMILKLMQTLSYGVACELTELITIPAVYLVSLVWYFTAEKAYNGLYRISNKAIYGFLYKSERS